jgi:hypothetical protein
MNLEEMLTHAMHTIESGRTQGYLIPLAALDCMVSLSAGQEPETFRCILTHKGEPQATDIFTKEQVLTTVLKVLQRNERLIQLQAAQLAAQTEKFLKELAASE